VDSTTEENKVVSLTVALCGMGCTIIAAPVEHHAIIKAMMRPAVDAKLLGPVLVLNGDDGPAEHEAHLSAAADLLLGIRQPGLR
jgi:hypothetical protein